MPLEQKSPESFGQETGESKEKEEIQKVALATVTQVDLGMKALAGALQKEGFNVGKFNLLKDGSYTEEELEQIIEKFRDFDVIGLSVTDMGFNDRVIPLIKAIKERLKKPVILGGSHAVLDPIDCLKNGADAVCLGEADYDFTNLLKNWSARNGQEIRNFVLADENIDWNNKEQVRVLEEKILKLRNFPIENINELTPDFSYHNYWVLQDGKLIELTPETIEDFSHHQIGHKNTIVYASDRGCPFSCTYCYNRNMRDAYSKSADMQDRKMGKYHRRKDVKVMIQELEDLKRENPQIRFLNLMNDDMAARSIEELREFAKLYKEKIGWPFYCMVSPQSIGGEKGREKVKALVEAGVKELNMGIQTNSKTNREVFGRIQSDELLVETTRMFNEFCRKDPNIEEEGKIDVFFDFIIHNPFESEEDVRRTIDLIKQFPTPFDQVSHSLFVGRTTVLRKVLDKKQAEAKEKGEKVDRVMEDGVGESDFHDTHKFYEWLKDNQNFEINTFMEFMAGRHDQERMGRIPRLASDLLEFPAFKILLENNSSLMELISEVETGDEKLSIDFLTDSRMIAYFKNNQDVFGELIRNMDDTAPIRYTNQRDNYSK